MKNQLFFFLINWLWPLSLMTSACSPEGSASADPSAPPVANEEVAAFAEAFEGRGDQADDSRPIPPGQVLESFTYPKDLVLDLLASEPLIRQPVELNFDHRGRLWVVQYSQYPYPAGLKITGYDYHLRAQFDKIPQPPPLGDRGADKITLLEDTDHDGRYDQATDAISGLNIATAVTWGRGNIWVLNPPYLLAYPDPDGDGFPDGDPIVKLQGFGLEDTHAVANSLRWGPDGWLYGAQGSTTTADISSSVTKNVRFNGQAIWRYQPETEVFELFAEGGGNTFHVEIDDKGRVYSGHNGGESRGQYYKQGGYYPKNWGKHGPLTNPYSFGYLDHMPLEGENLRFTHAFLRYGGNNLPVRYHDALIGINPLHNFLQVSRFVPDGSSFGTMDTEKILVTEDHWFRPVDIKNGPDGGVYIADWYDSRLSHIDPNDTWHRPSGRIYRLKSKNSEPFTLPDFSQLTGKELIRMLAHENRWMRRQALHQFGERKDKRFIPKLKDLLSGETGQLALEALWALHLSGGFDQDLALAALRHTDPFVRMWAVRLLGDQHQVSPLLLKELEDLAGRERHPEVRSQLASSVKRLEGTGSLSIMRNLIRSEKDTRDPHNPLLIWWALEDKAEKHRSEVIALFNESDFWEKPLVRDILLERLMQRYVMAGGEANLNAATQLLTIAPSGEATRPLLSGLMEGLRGRELADLPPELYAIVKGYQEQLGENTLSLSLRQGNEQAIEKAILLIQDPATNLTEKLEYIRILGEVRRPPVVPVLLNVVQNNGSSPALRQAALQSLGRYAQPEIGKQVADWYPDRLRADPDVRHAALEVLVSRPEWAYELLDKIQRTRQISATDLPLDLAQQLVFLEGDDLSETAQQLWPEVLPLTSKDKTAEIRRIKQLVNQAGGNPEQGKVLFNGLCSTCHQLFDQGGTIGPDLTGYERSNLNNLLLHIVDPNVDIREGYLNYLVTTTDGQYLSGRITDRTAKLLRLQTLNGNETTLSNDQIRELKALEVSLMPERLLDQLSGQEVKDLFAYLMN